MMATMAARRAQPTSVAAAAQPPRPPPLRTDLHVSVTKHVRRGQSIRLVGASPELGKWDPKSAPSLNWTEGDVWAGTVGLDEAGAADFCEAEGRRTVIDGAKLVVVGRDGNVVEWEEGDDRSLKVECAAKAAEWACEWGNPAAGEVSTVAERETWATHSRTWSRHLDRQDDEALFSLALSMADLPAAGAALDAADVHGQTAAMLAAAKGRVDVLAALADAGADVNAVSRSGATALMAAARAGETATVEALSALGAHLDAATEEGHTAVMFASEDGHAATVEALAKAGANANKPRFDGWTAAMFASWNGQAGALAALVAAGANVNARTRKGNTAAMMAAHHNNAECLRVLVDAGANLQMENGGGDTAAVCAAKREAWAALRVISEASGGAATALPPP